MNLMLNELAQTDEQYKVVLVTTSFRSLHIRLINPKSLFAFEIIFKICWFQFRSAQTFTQRSSIILTLSSTFPSILYWASLGIFLHEINMALRLPMLKVICHLVLHRKTELRS